MSTVFSGLTLCAVVSALVLIVSGASKVQSRASMGDVMDALGLPGSQLPSWLVAALPWAEIVLGGLLLIVPGMVGIVVAACVLALFCAYLVVIIRVVATIPDPVECHCFGDLAPGDVSGRTITRNSVLVVSAVLALVAAVDDRRPVVQRILEASASNLWWWLAAVVAVVAVATIFYRPAVAVEADDEEELADYETVPIPLATVKDIDGEVHTIRSLAMMRPVLLLFVSPGCRPCERLLEKVPGWINLLPEVDVRCAVESKEEVDELPEKARALALVDEGGGLRTVFEVAGSPTGWLLGADGRIAGGPQIGPGDIGVMVDDMRAALDEAFAQTQDAAEAGGTLDADAVEAPEIDLRL